MVIDLYPETAFFTGKYLAVPFNAAAARAVYHFFGAAGLVTEKAAGIQGAITAHFTTVQNAF